jgi:hypothetical protein
MLAVPDGRWLDEELAQRGLAQLTGALAALHPGRLGLGIGGLNKSTPAVVLDIIERARAAAPACLIFATGSSFAREITAGRPESYWSDLRAVFAAADVVSISSEEERQLGLVWGEDWARALTSAGPTRLVVTHAPTCVTACEHASLSDHLTDLAAILKAAQAEATLHSARGLTGLGARFDGVLSCLILARWRS